jgi:hypothetical protein
VVKQVERVADDGVQIGGDGGWRHWRGAARHRNGLMPVT